MKEIDILIRDGIIVTMDENRRILRGSVAIRKDRIIEVGKTEDLEVKYKSEKIIDAKKKVVMPGFVDAHNHLRTLTPGYVESQGLRIDEALKLEWKLVEHADKNQYYAGALLRSLQSIKSGITCMVDHCYPFHKPTLDEQSLKAFRQVGIRGILARGIMTTGYEPICETKEDAFTRCANLIERNKEERWRIMVAPISFRQSSPDDFREARDLADRYHVRLYTHVSETPQEVNEIRKKYGKTPIALLHELGFSGPDVTLVHVIYPTDEEIQLMHDTQTKVVDCPSNHMFFAKGVTPTPQMLNRNIVVGLGTDEIGDMFSEMRNEVLSQRIHHLDPKIISSKEVLEMATIKGATALGLGDEIGSIEPGKKADIIILDLDKPHLTPLFNIIYTLVYLTNPSDVHAVLVDGKIIMDNSRIITIDETKVVNEANKASGDLVKSLDMNSPYQVV